MSVTMDDPLKLKVLNQDILKMSNNILSSADRQSLSADSLLGSEHLTLNGHPGLGVNTSTTQPPRTVRLPSFMTRPVLKKPIRNSQSKSLLDLLQQNHERQSQSKSKPELRVQVLRKNLEAKINLQSEKPPLLKPTPTQPKIVENAEMFKNLDLAVKRNKIVIVKGFQEAVNHLTKKGLEHMTLKPEVRSKIGEFVSAKKSIFEQEITELMEVMDKVEKEKKEINSDLLKNIEEINEKILERIAAKTGLFDLADLKSSIELALKSSSGAKTNMAREFAEQISSFDSEIESKMDWLRIEKKKQCTQIESLANIVDQRIGNLLLLLNQVEPKPKLQMIPDVVPRRELFSTDLTRRRLVSASSDHQALSANVLAPNPKMLAQNGTLENFNYLENVIVDVDMEDSDDDMFA